MAQLNAITKLYEKFNNAITQLDSKQNKDSKRFIDATQQATTDTMGSLKSMDQKQIKLDELIRGIRQQFGLLPSTEITTRGGYAPESSAPTPVKK